MAQDATDLLTVLVEAERALWRALLSGDAAARAALVDDAFLGVHPTGFGTGEDLAGPLASGAPVAAFRLDAPRVLDLGPDLALLACRAVFFRSGSPEPQMMYVSTLWHRAPGGWRALFSQDTPATPEPER